MNIQGHAKIKKERITYGSPSRCCITHSTDQELGLGLIDRLQWDHMRSSDNWLCLPLTCCCLGVCSIRCSFATSILTPPTHSLTHDDYDSLTQSFPSLTQAFSSLTHSLTRSLTVSAAGAPTKKKPAMRKPPKYLSFS